MEILLGCMTKEDIPFVAGLERECFSTPWSENALSQELTNEGAVFFTAKKDGVVVGYMGMHCVCSEGHITNVAVHPDYRRKSIASTLINYFINHAKKNNFEFLTLEVRESNSVAISCYEKFGFREVGIRKKYYEHKEDAILMTLFLG